MLNASSADEEGVRAHAVVKKRQQKCKLFKTELRRNWSGSRSRFSYVIFRYVILGLLCAFLPACSTGSMSEMATSGSENDFISQFPGFGSSDLKARYHGEQSRYGTMPPGFANQPQLYSGQSDMATNSRGPIITTPLEDGEDGYVLNFENASVAAVCESVLGQILKLNYTIDPRLNAKINLTTVRAIPKDQLMDVLEVALKPANALVVKDGSLVRVAPAAQANASGSMDFAKTSKGYGTTVIPVKYVSVKTVANIMKNFASRPDAITMEESANLIIVQGTSAERTAALKTAKTIDTQLMQGWAVGIFPLRSASPATIITELAQILDSGKDGILQNQVRFQPMERMNAVLVVGRTKLIVSTVNHWIRRLDQSNPAAAGLKIYRLRYAQALPLSKILNNVFANGTATFDEDQATLAPDSSSTKTSSSDSASSSDGNSFSDAASDSFDPTEQSTSDDGLSSSSSSVVRIAPDTTNNSLLIYASPETYKLIETAIRSLDLPPVQVAVEATIAEVTLTDELQYGVELYLQGNELGVGDGSLGLTTGTSDAISSVLPGANLVLGSSSSPQAILSALHQKTAVKVLSAPSMVVLDNEKATLQVGDSVAVKTASSESTDSSDSSIVSSIDYRDTGVILKVIPHVHSDGSVKLDLNQIISDVVDDSGSSDGLNPTFSQRQIKSSVNISSGQTVMLAGLISQEESGSKSGLPDGGGRWRWISDIFSTHSRTVNRNELIIFIKPTILKNHYDAQAISEEFRDRFQNMLFSVSR